MLVMPLAAGQTLTFYEILGPLGAGGMGEVWHAKDTRLEREVAIKVLPEHFADDEDRLRRFEREAKTLASLHHPNVASIFGIDQVDSTCFMAMELVSGEDLATRLTRGALPVDEALDVCRQIAEGLEAAHEAGVVHRDLKPANVRITPDGVVKILDFGLAKPIHPRSGERGTTTAESDSFLVTEEGLVLGTPTYMSPEQARGKPVDKRTDVWAFGCVLYECLAGRRAFGGESLTDVLAAIVEREPDWSRFPDAAGADVRRLLGRCLTKDPRMRLRDIGEARVTLSGGSVEAESQEPTAARRRPMLAAFAAGVAVTALAVFGAGLLRPDAAATGVPATRKLVRMTVDRQRSRSPRISPDGRRLVYASRGWLWVRDLAELEPRRLPGTEGVDRSAGFETLAWSPDGASVAFPRAGFLEILRLGDSLAEHRCALPRDLVDFSLADDGAFLFEVGGRSEGVLYLAPGASEPVKLDWIDPETLTTPHRFNPSFLPGGDEFLITDSSGDEPWIRLASLSSRSTRPLVRGRSQAQYVAPGWIAWVDEGRLLVQPFDRETSTVSGAPREVAQGVYNFGSTGDACFSFSAEGTLAYDPVLGALRIEWVDRQGRSLGPAAEARPYYTRMRLDGTGRWLAASVITPKNGYRDLWIVDLDRGTSRRFTHQVGWEDAPAWSPDGKRIAFAADWNGPPNVYVQDVGGGEAQEVVPFDNHVHYPGSWSADGRSVLYSRGDAASGRNDLWMVDVDTLERRPLLETSADELDPQASPDGRWVAYTSDETGRREIYVATYPDLRGTRRVSAEGGRDARWKRDSSELYYLTGSSIEGASAIASAVIGELDGLPDPGPEVVVIQPSQDLDRFDVTPDATRFLVVRRNEDQVRLVTHLVLGWERLLE